MYRVFDFNELAFVHKDVYDLQVEAYRKQIRQGINLPPIEVIYCLHRQIFEVADGHNRSKAYFLEGAKHIVGDVSICTHWLDTCGGNLNDSLFSIRDLELITAQEILKEYPDAELYPEPLLLH